jgi:hypothetical protein
VERWFATLTDKQIRRGSHRSPRALIAAIKQYLAVTNETPKPLVWTKTADEILVRRDSLFRKGGEQRMAHGMMAE